MARYFRRGTTKIYFVPEIEDVDAPTESEMGAGMEISCDIAEVSGFTFTNSPIDTPDMCAEFVKRIPGEDTAEDSELTFYEDDTSNPLFTTLAKGSSGFIVFFPYGTSGVAGEPATGDDCEVWPVSVARLAREWSAGNDAARFMASFTITDVPGLQSVVVSD